MSNELTFDELFPHGIISFTRLRIKACLSLKIQKCTCFSALWKALLLFPRMKPYYTKEEWGPVLIKAREKYDLIKDKELKDQEQIEKIQNAICKQYQRISLKMIACDLDSILNVVSLILVQNNIVLKDYQLKILVTWACRLYLQFSKEAIPEDGSAKSILLSKNNLKNDLFLMLIKIIEHNSFIFNNPVNFVADQLYSQFNYLPIHSNSELAKIRTRDSNIKHRMVSLYSTFFEIITHPSDVPIVYSAIFANFQNILFLHYIFYSVCLFEDNSHSGEIFYPFELFIKQACIWIQDDSPEVRANEISQTSELINECMTILSNDDSPENRILCKELLLEINDVITKKMKFGELIPLNILIAACQSSPKK